MFEKTLTSSTFACKILTVKSQIHIKQEEIMPDIKIKVSGKIAICRKKYLVSSNANYTVTFDFDNEWDAHTLKTARFVFDSKYADVAFLGNTVELPKIPPCECLGIGVYSDSLASTTADVGCVLSVKDCQGEPVGELTDEQYDSLLSLINSLDLRQIKSVERNGDLLVFSFTNNASTSVELHDGASVSSANVGADGQLSLTLSNGKTIIAGSVQGKKGERGEKGEKGDKGDKGEKGEKGDDAQPAALKKEIDYWNKRNLIPSLNLGNFRPVPGARSDSKTGYAVSLEDNFEASDFFLGNKSASSSPKIFNGETIKITVKTGYCAKLIVFCTDAYNESGTKRGFAYEYSISNGSADTEYKYTCAEENMAFAVSIYKRSGEAIALSEAENVGIFYDSKIGTQLDRLSEQLNDVITMQNVNDAITAAIGTALGGSY